MLEDSQIIGLYWARDDSAITETDRKYGAYCSRIAVNILQSRSDAEECVNDTYLKTWDTIPPQRPESFPAFLGRIIRNIALDRYRRSHAKKRGCGMDIMLSELEGCIPAGSRPEEICDLHMVTEIIDRFLAGLSREKRILFVRRYWYAQSVRELADGCGMTEGQVKSTLFRLRGALRSALEKEGVQV